MYEQLLVHLFGDFILQNDNVGVRKKEQSWTGLFYCVYHCITYAIPFLLIASWQSCIMIGIGHFLVDRWNIVGHFIRTKNFQANTSNFGYKSERPFAIIHLEIHHQVNQILISLVNVKLV